MVVAGALALPAGPAFAQCVPLTAGADNVVCAGALDGINSDALAGNDTITINTDVGVSLGATISGGADDDIIALTAGQFLGVNAMGAGQVLGDAGSDTITLNNNNLGYYGAGTVSGGADDDSISLSNNSRIGASVNSVGQVLGDAGADTITITTSFVGLGGDGTVSGGDGADSIFLGVGTSVGTGTASTGRVLGDAGADTIRVSNTSVGGNGSGTISGGDDADSIAISGGSRIARFATGSGQVLGDAGNDTITVDSSSVGYNGDATVSGGAGNDSIQLSNNTHVGYAAMSTGLVAGDAGSDTITLNNSYVGSLGDGTVSGGAGNDSIALSNFSYIGRTATGTGQVLGDAGSDTITLDRTSVGHFGAGTVAGGDGHDSIVLINASHIGVSLNGTGQVLGDAGNDTITLDQSDVGLNRTGTVSGGAGNDSIALSNNYIGRVFNAAGEVLGDDGDDTITLSNTKVGSSGFATVSGGAGNDSIALSNGTIIGNSGAGTGQVLGDAGDDTISIVGSNIGGMGAATVDGGADNDSITLGNGTTLGATGAVLGGSGDDTIAIFEGFTQNAGSLIDGGAGMGDFLELNRVTDLMLAPGGLAGIVTVVNFEGLATSGPATVTLNGNHMFTAGVKVLAGTLINTGALTAATTSVSPGAVLETSGGSFVGNVANSGTFSPGGDGTVETVAISGNFSQSPTGTLNVDVSPTNGSADKLDVGGTATLGGTLELAALGAIAPTNQYVIIDAAVGVIGTFDTINQSVAITQSVVIDGTTVVLRQTADFGAGAGTPNQIATGDNLNLVLAGGANGNLAAALQALAGITDPDEFQAALDQLHAEPYLAQYLSTWFASNDFATTLMSCPVSNGAMSVGVEGQCIWAKTSVRKFDQDRTTNNIGVDEKAFSIAGGAQFALSDVWHLGFGARYERSNTDIDTRAETDGDRFNFGAALKGRWGDTTLATVVEGGFANYDTTRFIRLPGLALDAQGEQNVGHVTTHARLAHSFKSQAMYVRPMIDLSVTYISLGSVSETGAGNLGLNVSSSDEWIFAATPAVEFGSEFAIAGGSAIVRPFIRAGVTFLSDDNIAVSTSFLGAPAGVSPFTISSEFDDVFAVLDAGINIIGADGMTLKINYGGQYGEDTRVHSGGAKLGVKF